MFVVLVGYICRFMRYTVFVIGGIGKYCVVGCLCNILYVLGLCGYIVGVDYVLGRRVGVECGVWRWFVSGR